eukprot:344451-Amphidinium_carterae.1
MTSASEPVMAAASDSVPRPMPAMASASDSVPMPQSESEQVTAAPAQEKNARWVNGWHTNNTQKAEAPMTWARFEALKAGQKSLEKNISDDGVNISDHEETSQMTRRHL